MVAFLLPDRNLQVWFWYAVVVCAANGQGPWDKSVKFLVGCACVDCVVRSLFQVKAEGYSQFCAEIERR